MSNRVRVIAAGAALALLQACGGSDAASAEQPAESAGPRPLLLTEADVTTAAVRDVTSGIVISGSLVPATSVTITAQVGGTMESFAVDRGSVVQRGQELARISADGVRSQAAGARANLAAAQAALAAAQTRRDAARRLNAAGATSRADLEAAEAAYQGAEAQLAAATAQATMANELAAFTVIRAPMDGAVSARAAEQGQPIAVGDPVLTVVNTRELELAGRVPVDEAGAVRIGQRVEFRVDAFPDRNFTGTVDRKDPTASESDRQVGVYVRLPNPRGELIAGQYAHGDVAGRSLRGALTVPETAVRGSGAEAAVFVVGDGKLTRRPVVVGARDVHAGVVAITAGLAAGERILVRPVPGLADGQPVTIATDR